MLAQQPMHASAGAAGQRARPLAPDAKHYVATPIGQVHLAGLDDGQASASLLLLLRGSLVYGDARLDCDGNTVHLDPRRFHARLPARDALVDETGALRVVEAVLKAMWRARLEEAKRTLPDELFVTRFFNAAATWGAGDLFADVGLLPGRLLARITGYPIQEGYGPTPYLQPLSGLVRREQFASGQLQAVMLPPAQTDNFAYWMFARANGLHVLTRCWGLAEGHWLWDYVPELDAQPAEVEIVGEYARATLRGQWIAPHIILCQAYRVRIPGQGVAQLTGQAMAWPGRPGGEALIIVPEGEQSGGAVAQCSRYIDEDDRLRDDLAAHDRAALAGLIRGLRAQRDNAASAPRAWRELDPAVEHGPGWPSHTRCPDGV